jgi:23S rRNA pseudouridine1911/1915/1917 synthase
MKSTPKKTQPRNVIAYTAVYKVNHSDTLLEFLLRKCNTSRNNVKSLLARRQVVVNGAVVTQFDFPLAKDDEVKLAKSSVQGNVPQAARTAEKKTHAPRTRQTIKILYEDDDFVAIDKPVGLLSVESDKDAESAYSYLLEYLSGNGKNARPFVLHRIDKETSGVLVFAKNVKIHSMLKLRWSELVSERQYYAVAEGKFDKKEDTLISYLKENANNLVYATKDPSGQKAVTNYRVVKESEQYSLLEVHIETGRKNQIRVQLHEIGHSIVGDEKYGFMKDPLKRLGLHASRLTFQHPQSGELITITAPIPVAFKTLFD